MQLRIFRSATASLLSAFGIDDAPNAVISSTRQEYRIRNDYVETFCSLSTLFRTVGRFIMRSCQAV